MKRTFLLFLLLWSLWNLSEAQDTINSIIKLEEIVVNGGADRFVPSTFVNVESKKLGGGSLIPEVSTGLRLLPSITMSSENGGLIGNQTFRIRGVDATRINVTVDGVPINDSESQAVFWVNMPNLLFSVEEMQLQRGIGTSNNGSAAFGGSLNMQTWREKDSIGSIEANLLYGSYSTWKGSVRGSSGIDKNGRFSMFSASFGSTEGFIEHGFSRQGSIFLSSGVKKEKSEVRANIFFGSQRTGITWEGVPEEEFGNNMRYNASGLYVREGILQRYDNQTDNYTQLHAHLHYNRRINLYNKIESTAFYTLGKGYYEEYNQGWPMVNFGDIGDYITRREMLNHLVGVRAGHQFLKGKVRIYNGLMLAHYIGNHYGNLLMATEKTLASYPFEWYRNRSDKSEYSIFSKLNYSFTNKIYGFLDVQYRGLRYQMNGLDDDNLHLDECIYYNFINPKLGLTYSPNAMQKGYLSLGLAHREPTRADLKDALKTNAMNIPKRERLFDLEAGFEQKWRRVSISSNVFYMRYWDQLVFTGRMSEEGYALMENVESSYRAGLELSGTFELMEKLHLAANYTFSMNKIRNYSSFLDDYSADGEFLGQSEEVYTNVDIALSPRNVGALNIIYRPLNWLCFNVGSKFVSKQYCDNTMLEKSKLDGYSVTDVSVEFLIKIKANELSIKGSTMNLFNSKYVSSGAIYRGLSGGEEWAAKYYFPGSLRAFYVQLSLKI